MPVALMVVDGGHLLAGAGRCSGLGPARTAGAFDTLALLRALHALVPREWSLERTYWYDGVPPGMAETRDLQRLQAREDVVRVGLPVRGGRQRLVEAVVLRDVLEARLVQRVYLVGDPRRHALTVQAVEERHQELVLVGVSDGESTPAERVWLRRPELMRCLSPELRRRRTDEPRATYQSPRLHSTPVRVPRSAPRPGA